VSSQELWKKDAVEIADGIRQGEISATEVLEICISRIESLNPRLNAVVAHDFESARKQAAAIDQMVAKGDDPGPFAGVPILVKDLEDARGLPTTKGSLLFKDHIAERDSTHVERLRAAGVVVVGKSAAPEFGSTYFTRSKIHGITRNPWNLERTSGGSSGGSSAAVASGMVPIATASDGGGSTRIPASFTGLVGHKPTRGLIPHGPGHWTISHFSVLGCLARSVRDAARHLDVVAGISPLDTDTYPIDPAFENSLKSEPIAVSKAGWSDTMGFGVCDPEVSQIARKAAEVACESAGLELRDVEVPFKDPAKAWSVLGSVELVYELSSYLPDRYDDLTPAVQASLQMAKMLKLEDVGRAADRVSGLVEAQASLFEEIDVLFTPTTATTAIAAEGIIPHEIGGVRVGPFGVLPFTYPLNLTGNPAISVPAGIASDGMPVGLQIAGPRFSDAVLLQIAYKYEESSPWPKLAPISEEG
jgi:aspartyl-tRNA(Asn)/glutamyl-tRNA(Gln) amidotransferase subunit A